MGTKYSSVSISGYNSAPPSDDGSATASNQVKWSTIKTKLPDPLKTAIESINTALVSFVDQGPSSITSNYTTVASDHLKVLSVSAGVTISLGDAASMAAGYMVGVKNGSTSGNVTVAPVTSADTLNGVAEQSGGTALVSPQQAMWFICTGSGYQTINGWLGSGSSPSKQVLWDASNLTAARTFSFPDSTGTLAITTDLVLPNHIAGLTLAPSGSSTTLNIAAGSACDVSAGVMISLSQAMTGVLASTWASGSGANKLDTGAPAASTWYHVHLIKNPSTGAVDVLFSLSATAPSLPSGYTKFRRIGSFKTNVSTFITRFTQYKDEFLWETPGAVDVDTTTPGTAAVTATLNVATGVQVKAMFNFNLIWNNASDAGVNRVYFSALDAADVASGLTATPLFSGSTHSHASGVGDDGGLINGVWTNTSAQIRYRVSTSDANTRIIIVAIGWVDPRGT